MLKHKITKNHYSFYQNLAFQVTETETLHLLEKLNLTVEKIQEIYKKDRFFNDLNEKLDENIHPAAFKDIELMELVNACLWKFVFVFILLKAEPVFVTLADELVDKR